MEEMSAVLGHDIDGRPLRVGDEVVLLSAEDPTLSYLVGGVYKIEAEEDGEMIISAVSYDDYEIGVRSENIRKLHNDHRPAEESFTEMMDKLKGEVV